MDTCARRYSSWPRVVRFFVNVLDDVSSFQRKRVSDEILKRRARVLLIGHAQNNFLEPTFHRLQCKQELPLSDPILPLAPFIDDDGLLRVGGRLIRAPIPYVEWHPVLIPPKHPIAFKIWEDCHQQVGHQGRHFTNAHVRQSGYFFPKSSSVTAQWLKACVKCKFKE